VEGWGKGSSLETGHESEKFFVKALGLLDNHFEYLAEKKKKRKIYSLWVARICCLDCLGFSNCCFLIFPYKFSCSNGRMLFPIVMKIQTWLYTIVQC